jgi:hypothetical protein
MHYLRAFLTPALAALTVTAAFAGDTPFVQGMAGTWDVQQRMWPGPGAAPVELPAAIAHRQLIDGKYLAEVMQPAAGEASGKGVFRRDALFNFNAVTNRYEYTSLDTRAPQLMAEVSQPSSSDFSGVALTLRGGTFLAPEWGSAKNVHFKYRLTVGAVTADRQIIQLYLTPQDVLPKKEFLAFEYVYTRRP